jgi:hypothetical protein
MSNDLAAPRGGMGHTRGPLAPLVGNLPSPFQVHSNENPLSEISEISEIRFSMGMTLERTPWVRQQNPGQGVDH